MKHSVTVVDISERVRSGWIRTLKQNGFAARQSSPPISMDSLQDVGAVLLGAIGLDPTGSVKLVETMRAFGVATPVVMLVERSSEALAIAALKAGVSDYF